MSPLAPRILRFPRDDTPFSRYVDACAMRASDRESLETLLRAWRHADRLTDEQRLDDALAELGELATRPEATSISAPAVE